MDQVRADRARRMVPDLTTWPNHHLPMKNVSGYGSMKFGMIHRTELRPDCIKIHEEGGVVHVFDNVETMIAAGWTVD